MDHRGKASRKAVWGMLGGRFQTGLQRSEVSPPYETHLHSLIAFRMIRVPAFWESKRTNFAEDILCTSAA